MPGHKEQKQEISKLSPRRKLNLDIPKDIQKEKESKTHGDEHVCISNDVDDGAFYDDHDGVDHEEKLSISNSPSSNNTNWKLEDFGPKMRMLRTNSQVKELQTILRDRETSRSDFIFYADRIIRMVVEEGLNQLPFDECTVITPTGAKYKGLKFKRGICGVSIVRCGEAMEKGLRECCRSIRIGKVLIKVDEQTNKPKVCYARFPPDIDQRRVLLMYPLLNTGSTVIAAINLLLDSLVEEQNVILLTLFTTPQGIRNVMERFPEIILLTTQIHKDCPTHFGKKYFGTE